MRLLPTSALAARGLLLAAVARHGSPLLQAPPGSYGDFVAEIKSAKAALRRGIEVEGRLPEGGSDLVAAIAEANPSGPDPAADDDLWSGTFSVLAANGIADALEGAAAPVTSCSVTVTDGSLELTAQCTWKSEAVSFRLTGPVTPVLDEGGEPGDLLQIDFGTTPEFTTDEGDAAEVAAAASPLLPSGRVTLRLIYLDQELLIADGGAGGEVAVLARVGGPPA